MRKRFVSMGLVLVVTVLLVMLPVNFSMLSLSAARGDLDRTQALAHSSERYYAACSRAEEVRAALILGEDPGIALSHDGGEVAYEIPIDGGRILCVTLREGTWEVLRWQTVVPWEP